MKASPELFTHTRTHARTLPLAHGHCSLQPVCTRDGTPKNSLPCGEGPATGYEGPAPWLRRRDAGTALGAARKAEGLRRSRQKGVCAGQGVAGQEMGEAAQAGRGRVPHTPPSKSACILGLLLAPRAPGLRLFCLCIWPVPHLRSACTSFHRTTRGQMTAGRGGTRTRPPCTLPWQLPQMKLHIARRVEGAVLPGLRQMFPPAASDLLHGCLRCSSLLGGEGLPPLLITLAVQSADLPLGSQPDLL